ncbi:MAG: hypothetical protein ACLRPO_07585, partial [Sutterella wadsworthensis]
RTIVRAVLKKQEASPDLLQIGRGAVTEAIDSSGPCGHHSDSKRVMRDANRSYRTGIWRKTSPFAE